MASFDTAYKLTSINEGGYAGNLGDGAGETYCGITRNNFPTWAGWAYIDLAKRKGMVKKGIVFASGPLPGLVKDFYKKLFWDRIQGDTLTTQETANLIYDWIVNSGSALLTIHKTIAQAAQVSVPASSQALTPQAVDAANEKPAPVYNALWQARKQYYVSVAQKPGYAKFLNNWLNRLYTFPQTLQVAQAPVQVVTSYWQTILKYFGL